MESGIIVENLSYTYPGQSEPSLKNVNFTVTKGDFVLVAGPTGCGKSTLVYCLDGLIPHVFEGELKGRVVVNDKDTRDFEVYQLAQSVGTVFQNTENQLCSLIVEDEIAFGPENLALPKDEIRKRMDFAVEATDIQDYLQKYVFNLSAGQKQRVVIASSLSLLPKILVLDEPLSELDPVGCREMLQTLKKLNKDLGMTIVIAEHKLEEVLSVVKTVFLMDEGRIVAKGEPAEVFKDVQLIERLGLRVPETVKFSYKLIKEGLSTKFALSVEDVNAITSSIGAFPSKHILNSNAVGCQYENYEVHQPLVNVEGLCYSYNDGTIALRDINLSIYSGDFAVVLGCNGAGKSTLAQVMTGLLEPTRGKIFIDGRDSAKYGVAELAGIVGYTFQNPEHQLFCETVRDEVAFGPRQLGLLENEVKERVKDAMHVMGLEPLKDRDPQALSRGQRLRVAIASVLSMSPKVLILDEPVAAQDLNQIVSLMTHLKLLNKQGLAVVIITHDINVVARYAGRVVLMAKGKIMANGEPHEVLSNEELLFRSGLSPPTAVRLSKQIGLPPMITVTEISHAIWGT
jgi:energy-coupling factor transporter ATP-binding protein EcfA2